MNRLIAGAVLAAASIRSAQAQDAGLTAGIVKSRSALTVENGTFAGPGAPVLSDALAKAKYVLIGEDHGTLEIPRVGEAVCEVLAGQGLTAYAIEAGPLAAEVVGKTLPSPMRVQAEAALMQKYPDSTAFLNLSGDNNMAARCMAATGGKLQFWGLDQEFMGASGLIFDEILKTHPPAEVKAQIEGFAKEMTGSEAKAKETGDPSQLFLMSASDAELESLRAAIAKSGSVRAQWLMDQLLASRKIYKENSAGTPDSNRDRTLLMKSNLEYDWAHTTPEVRAGKMLFKFGDWHLYRGFNPLHQLDLGNYLSEKADGEGASSLHIIVLGAKGSHLGYAGHGRPYQPQTFEMIKDDDYAFMKPFMENQAADGWSLFDLRTLRFKGLKMEPSMERLVYGYDLLVVVPEISAASEIR